MKFIDILNLQVISWLSTPEQAQVRWQYTLSNFRIDNLVDSSSIANASITNSTQTTAELQTSQQWVSLDSSSILSILAYLGSSIVLLLDRELSLSLLRLSLSYFLLSGSCISSNRVSLLLTVITISDTSIKLLEIRSDFL